MIWTTLAGMTELTEAERAHPIMRCVHPSRDWRELDLTRSCDVLPVVVHYCGLCGKKMDTTSTPTKS